MRHFYFPGRQRYKIGPPTDRTRHSRTQDDRENNSPPTSVLGVHRENMKNPKIASACLLLLLVAIRAVSGHAIDQQSRQQRLDEVADQKSAEPRQSSAESIFAGIAKSLISRSGSSSQTLSLNLSNVVLMLVLKGLIWGVSYMQTPGAGGYKGRKDAEPSSAAAAAAFTETDMLLFLGYLVADESGHYDCLNRVACEQPARAENYLKSAEMVWNTAKMFDGVMPLDAKYEKMLIRLQEAIEDGRANGDCEAKYKCSEPRTAADDRFNLI